MSLSATGLFAQSPADSAGAADQYRADAWLLRALVFANFVLVGVTWFYAQQTKRMADCMSEQTRPYVYVRWRITGDGLLDVLVANGGPRPAYNVSLSISHPAAIQALVHATAFQKTPDYMAETISCLWPGVHRSYRIGPYDQIKKTPPGDFIATVAYGEDGKKARRWRERFPMRLAEHVTGQDSDLETHPLRIESVLRRIQRAIENLKPRSSI